MRLYSLQALRFWAALGVCVFHALPLLQLPHAGLAWRSLASVGQSGVDVFFVLSGVVISLAARGATPGEFLSRRAQRILPLWYATALPMLGLLAAQGLVGWREALASLTLWPVSDRITSPVGVGWTLSFEALFYACAALVIWRGAAAFAILLGLFVLAAAQPVAPLALFIGNPLVLEFLAGVLIARLPPIPQARRLIWPALAALVVGAAFVPIDADPAAVIGGAHAWLRIALFGAPAALVVLAVKQMTVGPGLLTRLGDASFALYLIHLPLLILLAPWLPRLADAPHWLVFAAYVAAVVILAWRLHELFEKPVLTWLRRPGGPRPAKA